MSDEIKRYEFFVETDGIFKVSEFPMDEGKWVRHSDHIAETDALRKERDRAVSEREALRDEVRKIESERNKLHSLLVEVVNKGTDGCASGDVSVEFLSSVPAECQAVLLSRNALRREVADLKGTSASDPAGQESDVGYQLPPSNVLYKLLKERSDQIGRNGVCFKCDSVKEDDGRCDCHDG